MQSTQRYVVFAFLAIGVIVWVTIAKLLAAIAYTAGVSDPAILGEGFAMSNLIGLVTAIFAGVIAFRNETVYTYCGEVVAELKKCVWPDKKEVKQATIVVIVTALIIAAILAGFDLVWAKLTGMVYT